jgi:hypothetical protein
MAFYVLNGGHILLLQRQHEEFFHMLEPLQSWQLLNMQDDDGRDAV